MNGAGIGAFAEGFVGGATLGKTLKDMFKGNKSKDAAAKAQGAPAEGGIGIGQPSGTGDLVGSPVAGVQGGEATGNWGLLSGIIGNMNSTEMGA
ncbi:hypothetical protein D3C76_48160 [compost metagenome]